MSELFSPDFLFRNALLGGLGVVLLCSLVGIYLVLRRLVLIGVALPQASAAGVAVSREPEDRGDAGGARLRQGHGHSGTGSTHALALAGSLAATFGGLALLVLGQRRSRSPAEWGVGALFAIGSAATILFVAINPTGDMEMASLLRGELLTIADADLRLLAVALVAVGSLFFLFRRDLLLCSFDPEFARTLGREPLRYDLLLHALIGSVIALGVMTAGPLVVFGFLVLPALAALRVAPGLVSAFVLSSLFATGSFLGGFWLSYRVDLPAGPVCVATAAACWLATALAARLRAGRRAAALLLLVAATLALAPGCASRFRAAEERARSPLPRGTLPAALGSGPVGVLPFTNATGRALRLPQGLLDDARRAVGAGGTQPAVTVTEALRERALVELRRRGLEAVALEGVAGSGGTTAGPAASEPTAVGSAPADAPAPEVATPTLAIGDPALTARVAREAGFEGPVLAATLRRFDVTQTGLLLVRLELAIVDAQSEAVLWTGRAARPVPIPSALTWQEVLADAGGPIYAEAFGAGG